MNPELKELNNASHLHNLTPSTGMSNSDIASNLVRKFNNLNSTTRLLIEHTGNQNSVPYVPIQELLSQSKWSQNNISSTQELLNKDQDNLSQALSADLNIVKQSLPTNTEQAQSITDTDTQDLQDNYIQPHFDISPLSEPVPNTIKSTDKPKAKASYTHSFQENFNIIEVDTEIPSLPESQSITPAPANIPPAAVCPEPAPISTHEYIPTAKKKNYLIPATALTGLISVLAIAGWQYSHSLKPASTESNTIQQSSITQEESSLFFGKQSYVNPIEDIEMSAPASTQANKTTSSKSLNTKSPYNTEVQNSTNTEFQSVQFSGFPSKTQTQTKTITSAPKASNNISKAKQKQITKPTTNNRPRFKTSPYSDSSKQYITGINMQFPKTSFNNQDIPMEVIPARSLKLITAPIDTTNNPY